MDFEFTPEQEALGKEFEEYAVELMKDAPAGWGTSLEFQYSEVGWEFTRKTQKKLAEKGWLVRPWPKEYGGADAPIVEQLIYNQVMAYHRVPSADAFGIGMIGPTLLAAGSEEQKKEHLPPIARAERYWCQGWSEPNAGSDLASLVTRGVRVEDEYVVNGQKTWTTNGHNADWCFMLVRTNPEEKRSRGLTYLLVDMKTPGVTVRPLLGMNGEHFFNEVYFDDVHVPVKNRVGEENQGWAITRATMNFERSGIGGMSGAKRAIEDLVAECKTVKWDNKTLADSQFVRHRLAQLLIEIEAGTALAFRVAWSQEKGDFLQSAHLASASKVFGTELNQRIANVACQIFGLYGQVAKSRWAVMDGRWQGDYQFVPGTNIYAGSSEIQRNIISTAGLGMPRTW
ncbi:MAG: acyl-CoA dehydrogenase family protein [Chloroflexota bacterium]|nr:acyl-CoA dehydrogenase family protein [Chloroflexota bacterium]